MITTEGDVVGVNTAIIQGAQGLSFSVGINTAKEIASQLIKTVKVFKAYLGFQLQEVTINPKVKRHYHLPNEKGLFVVNVEENSPASRSQVQAGDILVSFNNKPVDTLHQLFKELTKKEILTLVDVAVVRHAELLTVGIFPIQKRG
jgi:S1-C subfamily serine protease